MVANYNNMLLAFDTCNMEYFEGKLLFPQFELLHSFRTCGLFQYKNGGWFNDNFYDPCISITDYYEFTKSQFVNLMCHEMIHYYLAYFGIDKRCRHGKAFKNMAKELNTKYGLNITSKFDVSNCKRREGTSSFLYWLSLLY